MILKHRTWNVADDEKPHDFEWNNIKILHKENNIYKRLFAEIIYIKKVKENSYIKITDTDTNIIQYWFKNHNNNTTHQTQF